MNSFFRAIVLVGAALVNFGVADAADDDSLSVRAGKLLVTGERSDMLLFNGIELDSGGFSFYFVEKYAVGDTDVVLMMKSSGGTACPALYFFVTVTPHGTAKLSPQFGTCSDTATPTQSGSKITVTMSKMTGRGIAKYVYSGGTLTENGKLIRDDSSQASDEGKVFINGNGIVLVSGNPDKRVLRCVQDRVEKSRSSSEGWDDRIIAECSKLKQH